MAAAHDAKIKVLLDGQGADELPAATSSSSASGLRDLLLRGHPLDAAREFVPTSPRGRSSLGSAMREALHAALPQARHRGRARDIRWRFGIRCTELSSAETARPRRRPSPGRISRPGCGTR